jgi:hypothetical protein
MTDFANFFPVNAHALGSSDAEPDYAAANSDDGDLNAVPYDDCLSRLPCEHQHKSSFPYNEQRRATTEAVARRAVSSATQRMDKMEKSRGVFFILDCPCVLHEGNITRVSQPPPILDAKFPIHAAGSSPAAPINSINTGTCEDGQAEKKNFIFPEQTLDNSERISENGPAAGLRRGPGLASFAP